MERVDLEGVPSSSPGRSLLAAALLGLGGYGFAILVVGLTALVLIQAGIPLTDQPTLLLAVSVVMGQGVAFGPWVAIGVASFVFAVVYVFSLQGQGKLAYLAILLVLSPILGLAYERTENLVVPSLVHGGFNAVQFYVAYLGATGGLS